MRATESWHVPIDLSLSQRTSTSTGDPTPDGGPIGRWLLDPATTQREFLNRVGAKLSTLWSAARPFIILAVVAIVAVTVLVWRLRV